MSPIPLKIKESYKRYLLDNVKKVFNTLDSFNDLEDLDLTDEDLRASIEDINEILSKNISKFEFIFNHLRNNIEWDSLNIAFFGETNAGKSTLIEALINGDGRSIGEGRKDNTKRISKKSIGNMNLLDMPGIEGDNHKLRNEIKKAVDKSHIIFYVIGTNKEPERKTIIKMKEYLKDRVKVFSFLNIRGKPSFYKYQDNLYNQNIEQIKKRTRNKFNQILSGHYEGHFEGNAYLGFLSKGHPKRKDFKKDINKLVNIFNTKEKCYNFSGIQSVKIKIDSFKNIAKEEIIINNTKKFLKEMEVMFGKLLRSKKEFDRILKKNDDIIKKAKEESEKIIDKYINKIYEVIETKINSLENDIKTIVAEGIENVEEKEVINQRLNDKKEEYDKIIKDGIDKKLDSLSEDINESIDKFKNRIQLNMEYTKLSGDIDIEKILKKMEINFKYILKQVGNLGLTITGVIAAFTVNLVVGIVTAIIAGLRKIWQWLFGDPAKRKREAKKKAYQDIKSSVKKMKREYDKKIQKEMNKIRNSIKKELEKINIYFQDLWNASNKISDIIINLNHLRMDTCKKLIQKITGKDIQYAYIDFNLSNAIIINGKLGKNEIENIGLENINLFKSLSELIYKENVEKRDSTLYVDSENEIIYRALNAFQNSLGIDKIKRKDD